ncbi:Vascular non-inflammatory molecule 3 [Heterocephalus glaber]|uniref:Vascular non-inflammatory molecule 3 n=1 Tax=Heterocephalus glaber TaxID=10181 RepID=G5BDB9_HETGA|nr:Vascular non-inflammatory molecule 3 [Heterocephalus glaber]
MGAHIIVTPEDGIYGWVFTRDTIYPYLEDIPAPEVNWIPCRGPKQFGNTPVQERLSCLAKDNSVYIMANIRAKKSCNASEPQRPPTAVTSTTPMWCLPLRGGWWPLPSAVVLVVEFQVDSVLYPTAWYNTLPLLSAAPFHSAWARAMRVNLLAANTHNTSMHMTGSGIYAPEEVKVYHYDMETSSGQLMLAELKSRPPLEPTFPPAVDWSAYARSVKPFTSGQSHFPGMIYFDEFTFTELKGDAGNYTVCHKDLCCHITYKMSEKRGDEVFALGAFDGLHTVEGQYYLQICTLLKCQTTDLRSCGEPVGSAFTKFEEFSLSGTFGTSYVFPQIVLSGSQLAPERHYEGVGSMPRKEVKVYHYDMETSGGQLMLAELKSRPRLEPTYPAAVDWSAYARSIQPFTSGQSHFPGMIYFDEFTFTELKGDAGNYTVCQKDLCCHTIYKMSEKRGDEVFTLGSFDRLHTVEGQYYLQICTLLKCQTTDLRSCEELVGSAFTKFEEFSLSGTFGKSYVFPQVVLSGSQLAPERHYEVSRDRYLRSRSGVPLPVLVMALYGRVSEKDPPRLGKGLGKLQ